MRKSHYNLILLNVIFAVSIVVSNVVGCKVVDFGLNLCGLPLLLSGGALTYAFTFLCTDIIGELWGKEQAKKAVFIGLAAQVFAIALIYATQLLPTNDQPLQSAYNTLLGQAPFFTMGSLLAYFSSQSWDVWIFHKVRNYYAGIGKGYERKRWIWNNVSTITSQLIDTSVYAIVSFGVGCGFIWHDDGARMLAGIIIGQYLFKVALAICDTPIFYLLTDKKK